MRSLLKFSKFTEGYNDFYMTLFSQDILMYLWYIIDKISIGNKREMYSMAISGIPNSAQQLMQQVKSPAQDTQQQKEPVQPTVQVDTMKQTAQQVNATARKDSDGDSDGSVGYSKDSGPSSSSSTTQAQQVQQIQKTQQAQQIQQAQQTLTPPWVGGNINISG